jgi:hypothetical protein
MHAGISDAHMRRNEARIGLLHLQPIDERRDEDVADCQQPDRDHEPGGDTAWPRDLEWCAEPFAGIGKSAGHHSSTTAWRTASPPA